MTRRPLRPQPPAAIVHQTQKLEPKTMLSGNVTASIVNDVLTVQGDQYANDLIVTVGFYDTTISGLSTRINGAWDDVVFPRSSNPGGIDIKLGNGRDSVVVVPEATGDRVFGDLKINGQTGFDTIQVRDVRVIGELYLEGGQNNDDLFVEGVTAVEMVVSGGHGADAIAVDRSDTDDDFRVFGGPDLDLIAVDTVVSETDRVRVSGGFGPDSIVADSLVEVSAVGNEGVDTVISDVVDAQTLIESAPIYEAVNDRIGEKAIQDYVDLEDFMDGTAMPDVFFGDQASGGFFEVAGLGVWARIIGPSTGAATPDLTSVATHEYQVESLDETYSGGWFHHTTASNIESLIPAFEQVLLLLEPGQRAQVISPPEQAHNRSNYEPLVDKWVQFDLRLLSYT